MTGRRPETILKSGQYLSPSRGINLYQVKMPPKFRKQFPHNLNLDFVLKKPSEAGADDAITLGDVLTHTIARQSGITAHNIDQADYIHNKSNEILQGYLRTTYNAHRSPFEQYASPNTGPFTEEALLKIMKNTDTHHLFIDEKDQPYDQGYYEGKKPIAAVYVFPTKGKEDLKQYFSYEEETKYIVLIAGRFGNYKIEGQEGQLPRDYVTLQLRNYSDVEALSKAFIMANKAKISSRDLLAYLSICVNKYV